MTKTDGQRMKQSNTAGPGDQQPSQTSAPVVCNGFKPISLIHQQCLKLVFSQFNCFSILIILISCVVQSVFQPCKQEHLIQEIVVCFVFVYFLAEMVMKMVVLGVRDCLKNNWHKFDFFVLCGEILDFLLEACGTHVEICFVFSPMRLFGRVHEMRMLVTMFLGILPMLGNVLILYVLIIYIFGIVGVQLWAGDLRYRCFLEEDILILYNTSLSPYYVSIPGESDPFICSLEKTGMRHCWDIPPYREDGNTCLLAAPQQDIPGDLATGTNVSGCVNWNAYYSVCRSMGENPNMGCINFDNIGYAWIAIFQTVTLEGWTDIMYYVMDSNSYLSFVFFIIFTIIGSFIIMNACAVVIATHYSEAKAADTSEPLFGTVSLKKLWRTLRSWPVQLYNSLRFRWNPSYSWSSGTPLMTRCWSPFQRRLKELVTGDIFSKVITVAIFINILTMAVEHHNQPQVMTTTLQICNILFTALFFLEMMLKMIALGWTYFQDWSSIFDFAIVIISLWELGANSDNRQSVIRAFLALRLGRLMHFLPYLHRQLLVLKRTLEEAAMLCWLLLFGIFLLSIVGMHLFGCKTQSSGADYNAKSFDVIDKRKNFDTLLWSMVTVFQVLTLDDWNYVLYNAMVSTSEWAAVYFVIIIILGKNVILSILVGIVVKSFQNQPEDPLQCPGSGSATLNPNVPGGTDRGPSNSESNSGQIKSVQVEEADVKQTDQDHGSVSWMRKVQRWVQDREDWSFYLLSPQNRFRQFCKNLVSHKNSEVAILICIIINCITVALERPAIQPGSLERRILDWSNNFFFFVFLVEMLLKVTVLGLVFGKESYCRSLWNIMAGFLVVTYGVDILLVTPGNRSSLGILNIPHVLRPLRMVERTPKLRLTVEALFRSVKPMGNIIVICGIFFFFYSILGVQLFKGKFYHCVGGNVTTITNKSDCLSANYSWVRKEYNFDNLIEAIISVFVMYSMDGWVNLMYDGLDAVGVDQQPVANYNLWMLLYFISFILMSFILLDMFIGVMVETFHKCQLEQRKANDPESEQQNETEELTYFHHYSPLRLKIHSICTNEALEYFMSAVILLNVLMMGAEHYENPGYIKELLEWAFYISTIVLVLEVLLKFIAFGFMRFLKIGWNVLDIVVVLVSVISIILNELKSSVKIPINPSIFRVVRILRLTQVLKTTKIKVLLRTIVKTLSQVGNIGLLFMFFFFIYAALGVELFGKLECSPDFPCLGLHRHTNFENFGVALLTLYKVSTGDNWNGILKDTMRECQSDNRGCSSYPSWVSPIFFASFVIIVQFVLVNLVVSAVIQGLEDSTQDGGGDMVRTVPPLIRERRPIQVHPVASG